MPPYSARQGDDNHGALSGKAFTIFIQQKKILIKDQILRSTLAKKRINQLGRS